MMNPARLVRAVFAGIGAFYDTLIPAPNVAGYRLDVPNPMCPTCFRVANSECPDAWHALNSCVKSSAAPVRREAFGPYEQPEQFSSVPEPLKWDSGSEDAESESGRCIHMLLYRDFWRSAAVCRDCRTVVAAIESPAHAGAVEAVPADTTPDNPTAGTDGPGGGGSPVSSPPGPTNWTGSIVPTLRNVLAGHQFYGAGTGPCDCGARVRDHYDWREHVAPLIADALASAHQAAHSEKASK